MSSASEVVNAQLSTTTFNLASCVIVRPRAYTYSFLLKMHRSATLKTLLRSLMAIPTSHAVSVCFFPSPAASCLVCSRAHVPLFESYTTTAVYVVNTFFASSFSYAGCLVLLACACSAFGTQYTVLHCITNYSVSAA